MSLSRVKADRVYRVILQAKLSMIDLMTMRIILNCRDILCIDDYVRSKHTIRDKCERTIRYVIECLLKEARRAMWWKQALSLKCQIDKQTCEYRPTASQ